MRFFGKTLEVFYIPRLIERCFVLQDTENFYTHCLSDIQFRIGLRNSLCNQTIECLFCLRRVV